MCNSNLNPCDQICKNKSHMTRPLKPINSMYNVIIHGLTITPFLLVLCLWRFIPLCRKLILKFTAIVSKIQNFAVS